MDAIRALIEAIVVEPDGDQLKITLKDDLAGIVSAARPPSHASLSRSLLRRVSLELLAEAKTARGRQKQATFSCRFN